MKKLLLTSLLSLLATCAFATATTFTPQTLAILSTTQNGYAFGDWKAPMSCTIEDKGRMVSIVAAVGPTITKYDSVTTVPAGYQGSWQTSTYPDQLVTTTRNTYVPSATATYVAVPSTLTSGAYIFSIVTTTGTHNIALFPNGFYVSKTNSNLYLPGC